MAGIEDRSMANELVDPMASVRAYLEAEKSCNTRKGYAEAGVR
jgi:hypothetical protein